MTRPAALMVRRAIQGAARNFKIRSSLRAARTTFGITPSQALRYFQLVSSATSVATCPSLISILKLTVHRKAQPLPASVRATLVTETLSDLFAVSVTEAPFFSSVLLR